MSQISEENTPPLSRTDIQFTLLIGFAALALYIRTLAPSLLWGDSAEFQTLSYTLGMTHPTGYATQIVIGKLFTLIPIHNIAYRVNLMSAFFGALAVANTYLIVLLLTNQRIAGLSAAMTLAFTDVFWWHAVITESYAPASGMLSTVWLCFLLWRKTGEPNYLFLAGLTGALSIGIHSTVVMTAPSVLILMLLTARDRNAWIKASLGAILGVAIFLCLFFFLDFHNPPSSVENVTFRPNLSAIGLTDEQYNSPVTRFLTTFPASHFWSYYFTAEPSEIHRRLLEYFSSFTIWQLLLILIGMVALLLQKNWQDGLYPFVSFLIIWGFAVTVSFSVYEEFYTPVAVMTSIWLGAGAGLILSATDRLLKQNQTFGQLTRIVVMGLLISLPIWNARLNLVPAIKNGYTAYIQKNHIYPIFRPNKAIQDAQKIIRRVKPNAIVLSDWDKVYSLVYTAQIEGDRKDITFHEAWMTDDQVFAQSMIAYINANIDTRPIYFTVDMPGMYDLYNITQLDDGFYQVTRK